MKVYLLKDSFWLKSKRLDTDVVDWIKCRNFAKCLYSLCWDKNFCVKLVIEHIIAKDVQMKANKNLALFS